MAECTPNRRAFFFYYRTSQIRLLYFYAFITWFSLFLYSIFGALIKNRPILLLSAVLQSIASYLID
ncbi:hypothetical protein D1164_21130 [Mariniphaga sediminis]|uniref:Uncharacterized protein n=1 Tax=Mariniphaga sediminis TaxID=1628158 RepID=A0A399CT17_9BACT|nr:hypothetical protein D1164_21130 [Mariniphaga sediminis]